MNPSVVDVHVQVTMQSSCVLSGGSCHVSSCKRLPKRRVMRLTDLKIVQPVVAHQLHLPLPGTTGLPRQSLQRSFAPRRTTPSHSAHRLPLALRRKWRRLSFAPNSNSLRCIDTSSPHPRPLSLIGLGKDHARKQSAAAVRSCRATGREALSYRQKERDGGYERLLSLSNNNNNNNNNNNSNFRGSTSSGTWSGECSSSRELDRGVLRGIGSGGIVPPSRSGERHRAFSHWDRGRFFDVNKNAGSHNTTTTTDFGTTTTTTTIIIRRRTGVVRAFTAGCGGVPVARCSATSRPFPAATAAADANEEALDPSSLVGTELPAEKEEKQEEEKEKEEEEKEEEKVVGDAIWRSGARTLAVGRSPYPLFFSRRLQVMLLLAMALILCSADRVIMSIAIVPLGAAKGWGETVVGIVQSSFLWGYMMTPIVGGSLADRYGGKWVLAAGIGIWSVATLLTPWAAQRSVAALCCVRVIMGLGEGVALPCMNNLLARWMPAAERARAVGIAMAGFTLGNMVGLLSAPLLMRAFGNSTGPFIAFGLIGLLWLPLWLTSATADPRQHPNLDPAELAYITGDGYLRTATEGSGVPGRAGRGGGKGGDLPLPSSGPGPTKAGKASPSTRLLPMSVLLRKPAVWANIVGNVVNNWGFFILLSWMPVYFKKVFGVNLRDAAWFSSGPWAVMAVIGYVAGMIADWMVHDLRMDISTVRKFMQCLGFLGPAVGLTLLRSASRPEIASLFLTLSLGLSACSQAGFIVNFQDLGPKHAGLLHGMANTVGTAAGILGTVIAGWLAETTGSFRTVLIVTSIVYAAGAAFWTSFGTAQQLFD